MWDEAPSLDQDGERDRERKRERKRERGRVVRVSESEGGGVRER